jgi:uncharacterized membrane protein
MTELYVLLPLIFGCYLLIIKVVLPMVRGHVAPNQGYGFRTPLTLSDERIWYPANRIAGRLMLGSSLIGIVVSIALCVVLWGQDLVLIAALCGVLLTAAIVPVLPAKIATNRIAAGLKSEQEQTDKERA